MAARKKIRRAEAQLGFDALFIEGGLLSPEWLTRVAQLSAGSQTEADYRIEKGLNLRDEIGRYWRIAQAYWRDFAVGRTRSTDLRGVAESFVSALLRKSFEFESLHTVAPITLGDRVFPIGHAALEGRVPVVIASAGMGLDKLPESAGEGGRRRSAFGLAQEYLNAQEGALWGIVSDGCTLRILRDNASLTRPAWIEADLERIFTEERYADFAALWLLLHETRFGKPGQPVTDCALEAWRNAGREEGTRAREFLRRGVEEALLALGQGFLAHPSNQALRNALQDGSLTTRELFQQLLRLVYRIIFLLTVEERGLLHPEGVPEATRKLYEEGYSLRQLRERSTRRSAHDRFSDRWEAMKIVFRGLGQGEPALGLPALVGLFARYQCTSLDAARLENRALLLAMFRLSWLRNESGLARVNWRDMGPEELGSVYESLLELVPQITDQGRRFAFATGAETKGNARKTTGSYYTPESLVQALLDSALEPVVKDTLAANPGDPEEALLSLSVVDPACGSGHFLLGAARRLAVHLARLRANGTPSASQYRVALRDVVRRCIYGVDLNPMAVELCKVSLWMEALEPGLPLTFLDSHIQQGNSLLGTTPELMDRGIPDAAWEPIEGDDKKTASALKKRNKKAAGGQRGLNFGSDEEDEEARALAQSFAAVDATTDTSAESLEEKERKWKEGVLGSSSYQHMKLVADAWCAAFVWPKQSGAISDVAPTNDIWRQLRDAQGKPAALLEKTVNGLAAQYHFFHWHIQFQRVFKNGGFDVVLGNPPWERVKLQEQEFFAPRNSEIASALNAAARKKLITQLPVSDPGLWEEWIAASRSAEGESHIIRHSGRYPLCGKGDVNTYALFAEHNRTVLRARGRAGFIVPTGIATDDGTSVFFSSLVQASHLARFESFENFGVTFAGVNNRQSFSFIVVSSSPVPAATLCFNVNQDDGSGGRDKAFQLSASDFQLLNPNTGTCPTFRSRRDADINLAIYRRTGILWRENDPDGNLWGLRFMRMLDMANDSGLFRRRVELEAAGWKREGNQYVLGLQRALPLIEAKMAGIFDHRYASLLQDGADITGRISRKFEGWYSARVEDPTDLVEPQYWVVKHEVDSRLEDRWQRGWLLGWRDICRSTDQRTVIASLIPRTAVGHKFPLLLTDAPVASVACLYACLCSLGLDYTARQKIGGTSLTYFVLKQLPVLAPVVYEEDAAWHRGTTRRDWLLCRVLELTYTAWDLEPFARDVGYEGPPFRWDPDRRFLLRCELDAAFFHLYGIARDDVDYILETFPVVRKNEEKAHGEYRTKRVILEIYDEMAEAVRSRKPYQTRLDPPPADPRVAHPSREGGKVIPLRPSVRPAPTVQPAAPPAPRHRVPPWTPELLPAVAAQIGLDASSGRWGIALTGADLGIAALAAVLRNMGRPASREEVERAVVLSVLPSLLRPKFDEQTRATWRQAIGANNMALTSIAALEIPWAEVLRRAAVEQILQVDENGRWCPGVDIDDAPCAELDARALVSLSWLENESFAVEDRELAVQVEVLRVA
jgi:hypothetical protein